MRLWRRMQDEFHLCGCTEYDHVRDTLVDALEWAGEEIGKRRNYFEVFDSSGLFYLIIGALDEHGYVEHGTAIRHPWLSPKGEAFLAELKAATDADLEPDPEDDDDAAP